MAVSVSVSMCVSRVRRKKAVRLDHCEDIVLLGVENQVGPLGTAVLFGQKGKDRGGNQTEGLAHEHVECLPDGLLKALVSLGVRVVTVLDTGHVLV